MEEYKINTYTHAYMIVLLENSKSNLGDMNLLAL